MKSLQIVAVLTLLVGCGGGGSGGGSTVPPAPPPPAATNPGGIWEGETTSNQLAGTQQVVVTFSR